MEPAKAEQKSMHSEIKHYTFGQIRHVYAPSHGHNETKRRKNNLKRAKIRAKRLRLAL
jgi:hypothetical protein